MTYDEAYKLGLKAAALCRAINSKGRVFERVDILDNWQLTTDREGEYAPCIYIGPKDNFKHAQFYFNVFEPLRQAVLRIVHHVSFRKDFYNDFSHVPVFLDTEECKALYELELLAGGLDL